MIAKNLGFKWFILGVNGFTGTSQINGQMKGQWHDMEAVADVDKVEVEKVKIDKVEADKRNMAHSQHLAEA